MNINNLQNANRFLQGMALTIFVMLLTTPYAKCSEINIDKTIKYVAFNKYVEVPAKQFGVYSLGQRTTGNSLLVEATPRNQLFKRLDVYICSSIDYKLLASGQQSNCRGLANQRVPFHFRFDIPHRETYYLILNNTISVMATKKADLKVTVTQQLQQEQIQTFKKMFGSFMQEIKSTFVAPDFNLNFQSCGLSNAFSTSQGGHITMCSELFYELALKGLKGAISGVMFHELGHTLLNLWGLPGWNNEETADEFALYMFYKNGVQEQAMDWISWLEEQNSTQQAINMLAYGDKHPLSIQRIRNAKAILNNPKPFMDRWNRLIYPHMTIKALTQITQNPQKYDDAVLAKSSLKAK